MNQDMRRDRLMRKGRRQRRRLWNLIKSILIWIQHARPADLKASASAAGPLALKSEGLEDPKIDEDRGLEESLGGPQVLFEVLGSL